MAVHMGLLVVSGLFGPCKMNVYKKKIAQLLDDYYALSSRLSNVCTAHMLSLTPPVTVATFE